MPRIRSVRVVAVAAGVLLFSLALAVAATRHTTDAASSPVVPRGHWREAFVAALAVAFLAYALVVALAMWMRMRISSGSLAAVGCLVQVLPLASPLLLSTDTFTYWDYGRLAAHHGANPYSTPPSGFPADPAYAVMGAAWHHSTTLYGPLFTWLSELLAHVVSSPYAAQLAFRLLAAASMVAIVLVLWRVDASPAAIVLVGWSPLFALHFAGGGHNDALMMALAVGAAAAGARRPWLAAVLWVASVAVKWVAVVLLLLDLLATGRSRRVGRAVRVAVAGAIAVVLSTAIYGTAWLDAFRELSHQSRRTGSLGAAKWLADAGLQHRTIVGVLLLATLAFLAVMAYLALTQRRRHLSLAGTGLAALQGWLNPWYTLWGGAMLEFEEARLLAAVANLSLAALVLRDVLPP
jgi:uncharacterized membrane protein